MRPTPDEVLQVLDDLMEESYREAVCIHESIHADYMERIGDVYVEFLPLYVSPEGIQCPAAVTNHKRKADDRMQMKADPLGYVKSIIAGGIAEEILTDVLPDGGTALDEEEIDEVFDTLSMSAKERLHILSRARAEIVKDLRSPAFRKALRARAKFYQHILEQAISEKSGL